VNNFTSVLSPNFAEAKSALNLTNEHSKFFTNGTGTDLKLELSLFLADVLLKDDPRNTDSKGRTSNSWSSLVEEDEISSLGF